MLALTRKADYALVALATLSKEHSPVSARTLADQSHLPHPVLRNILKQLTRGGLLQSTQGAAGGYSLARPAREISLAEVVRLIDGPVRFARCCPIDSGHDESKCRLEASCMIKGSVQKLHETVMRVLAGVNIEQIAAGNVPSDPLSTAAAAEYEIVTSARKPKQSSSFAESA
jgi:Rrf2 family protein